MVSDFIEQRGGFLRLTETEAVRAGASFPKTARVLLEYGAEKEGYWNSDRFMANIKDAVAIAEFKYPPETCIHLRSEQLPQGVRRECSKCHQDECASWRKAAMHARYRASTETG